MLRGFMDISFREPSDRWNPGGCEFLRRSFVVRPHTQDVDHSGLGVDIVDNAMLDVDPAGVEALEITDELFEPRWSLEGILRENLKNPLSLSFKACLLDVAGILDCVLAGRARPLPPGR